MVVSPRVILQKYIKKVELFQNMSEPQLRKFASAMTRVRFQEGDRIIQKGEKGEVFYIIEQGMVRVHDIGMGDSQTADQFLKEGEGFGERSLLTGEVRGANITAMSSVVVALVMHKDTFEQHIGELQHLMDFRVKFYDAKDPLYPEFDVFENRPNLEAWWKDNIQRPSVLQHYNVDFEGDDSAEFLRKNVDEVLELQREHGTL